jgi:hypothetical protein
MAASAWTTYNSFSMWMADGTFDLDADSFGLALFTSASNAATLTNTVLANITSQVAQANGYTTGGATLANVTWTNSSGVAKFTSDPVVFTATGGNITARFAAIYKNGTANGRVNPLVGYCLLDDTPADVTLTAGNTLTIVMHANGAFTVSRAA